MDWHPFPSGATSPMDDKDQADIDQAYEDGYQDGQDAGYDSGFEDGFSFGVDDVEATRTNCTSRCYS